MAFNSTYKAGTANRPVWDDENAKRQVAGNTSRGITMRFALSRVLERDERAD